MKRLITALMIVFVLLGTLACAEAAPTPSVAPVPAPAPAPVAESGSIFGGDRDESVATVMETPPMAPTPSVPVEEAGLGKTWASERMIVRTGDMALVVVDVAKALEQIVELAEGYDGYVVSSNSWRDGERLVGNISIRVPAASFDSAIRNLRSLAVEVNSESTSSTDVTEEYVDLSAKLHNLEASEAQLLELMQKAGSVEEILEVQRELADTRGEIEQTKGRMQYLEQTSSTSLINIYLEQAELVVSFSATSRTVKVGQNIRFDPDIGGGISPFSYEWDFGDGNTSTEVAPTHAYKSEGNYNVILEVTDDKGQTASKERKNYIDVLPGWSAGKVVSGAWNGLVTFGHVLFTIIIWVVYFIPLWIIIGVILYFAWWRRRKKKA